MAELSPSSITLTMNHDVIVIGAGPAGLSAAIALARGGVSVLVCEQAEAPGDKPCGEGLLPSALDELKALGVDVRAMRSAGYELRGVRYFSAKGVEAEGRFEGAPGLGLRRSELQRLLRRVADSTPGLHYRRGCARVLAHGDRCSVRLVDGVASPRLVVAADGLASRARKDAGVRSEHPPPLRYGARQHFAQAPWSDQVEVYFHASGEAYVTPIDRAEVNVAVLWQAGGDWQTSGGPQLLPTLLERFPRLAKRLRPAGAVDRACGRGPLRVRVRSPVRDGLILVGDAGGYLDPITGEGVGLSLAKSRMLAHHVLPVLKQTRGPVCASALRPYVRAARRLESRHRQLTHALLWLRRSPWFLERVLGALAQDPALFAHFLSVNQGQAAPLSLPAGSALALCRRVLSLRPPVEHAG